MSTRDLQLVSNERGQVTAVIVPIETWKEITSQVETNHLLKSETMKRRLQAAVQGTEATGFEDALQKAGIETSELQ